MFLFLLFLHFDSFSFLLCPSLSFPLLSLFSFSLGNDTKWPTRIDVSLNPNSIKSVRPSCKQSIKNEVITIHTFSCSLNIYLNKTLYSKVQGLKWLTSMKTLTTDNFVGKVISVFTSINISHIYQNISNCSSVIAIIIFLQLVLSRRGYL